MVIAPSGYDPLYLQGIDHFNRQEFFASHEAWEGLWHVEKEPARQFLKGMIQAAVALYHLDRNNLHGARKLLAGSQRYLRPYRPTYWGLDLNGFLNSMRGCFSEALATGESARQGIDPARVPKICLEPPP